VVCFNFYFLLAFFCLILSIIFYYYSIRLYCRRPQVHRGSARPPPRAITGIIALVRRAQAAPPSSPLAHLPSTTFHIALHPCSPSRNTRKPPLPPLTQHPLLAAAVPGPPPYSSCSSLRWSGTPPPRPDPSVVRPSDLAQLQSSLLLAGTRPCPGGQALGRRLRHSG
jgi:hypothetical protein